MRKSEDMTDEFVDKPRVAYFSMEIALRSDIPTYSGGLGILAGDTMRSAADLGLPMVAVSLVSRAGYFRQTIDAQGRQAEEPANWDPVQCARMVAAKVAVPIEGHLVWIGAWLYVMEGQTEGRQPVLLLDTDFEENQPDDRKITHYLYGDGELYRLKQEMVLGIGGTRLLQALGFDISVYHMNEGHSALLGVELLRRYAYSPGICRRASPRTICRGCGRCAGLRRIRPWKPARTDFHTIWWSVRSIVRATPIISLNLTC
jgi:glycogen phosphorylase